MSAAAATNATVQSAGASAPASHLNKATINNIVLLFLTVGITFVHTIPIEVRRWANTSVGGVAGLLAVLTSYWYFNWHTALLTALFVVLVINSGIVDTEEGFDPAIDTRLIANRRKWYIESVMGENPVLIEENNVSTRPVQDDTSRTNRGF